METGAVLAAGNTVERRVSVSRNTNAGRSIGVGRNINGGRRAGIRLLRRMATRTAIEDRTMRIKFVAVIALMLAGGLLSGCIIDPGGYGHHHYYHDRY